MPGCEPTSEQLHTVVGLIAGMGDSPGTSKQPTPTDKLKEALSSKDAFRKHYLELAELSMGIFFLRLRLIDLFLSDSIKQAKNSIMQIFFKIKIYLGS